MKGLKTISIVLIVLGALLYLVGLQFRIMHWPDMFKGTISGPMVLIIGLIVFVIYRTKIKSVTKGK
jgi:predicted membrane channel-forming protein YqfA (hemolysin III family)